MPDHIIQVSSTQLASLINYAGILFQDLWPLIALAVGVPFGLYLIHVFMGLIPKGRSGRKQ